MYITMLYLILMVIIPMKSSKTKFLLSVLPLFIIALFRFGMGTDYFSYKYIYFLTNGYSFRDAISIMPRLEKGFLLVLNGFQHLGFSYHPVIVLLSLVSTGIILLWIYRNSKSPNLSLLLYFSSFFLVWHLSGIRQGIVLSFSLMLFFDKQIKLKIYWRVLSIIALATIHISALFLILFLFIENMNFNQKKIVGLFIFSILLTLFPLEILFDKLVFIPGIAKLLEYRAPSSSLLSFSSVTRYILFAVVFVHYDLLSKDQYNKKLADVYLIGNTVYFLLIFSEVASGRLFSYSFITSVLLFPELVGLYNRFYKKLAMVSLILFSSLFFYKEINSYSNQVGLVNDTKFVPFVNIINKNDYKFNNNFYFLTEYIERKEYELKQFNKKKDEIKTDIVTVDANMNFYGIYSENNSKFFVINNHGQVVSTPLFPVKPIFYKHYARYDVEDKIYYYDLVSQENVENTSLIDEIDLNTEAQKANTFISDDYDYQLNDNRLKEHIDFPEHLDGIAKFDYTYNNEKYSKVSLTYYNKSLEFMYDGNFQLLFNDYYFGYSQYDDNGFFTAYSPTTQTTYYKDGTLIWIEKK